MAYNRNVAKDTQHNVGSSNRSNFFIKPKRSTRSFPNNISKVQESSSHLSRSVITPNRKLVKLANDDQTDTIADNNDRERKKDKKPFDKKMYRLKKYSKKFKIQQWEDHRRETVLRNFYKQVEDSDQKFDVNKVYNDPRNRDTDEESEENVETKTDLATDNAGNQEAPYLSVMSKKNRKPFYKAKEQFKKIQEEKDRKKEEFLKKKLEKKEALKKYRQEKAEKFRKLSRKTKKGQPIMKDRMEMLFEKIQKLK